MTNLGYNPPVQSQRPTYVPKLLQTCTHVFVRDLAKTNTLQPAYIWPFKILKRQEKVYQVETKKLPQNIAVDRLKPPGLDATWFSMDTPMTLPRAPVGKETIARSDRHVQESKRLKKK